MRPILIGFSVAILFAASSAADVSGLNAAHEARAPDQAPDQAMVMVKQNMTLMRDKAELGGMADNQVWAQGHADGAKVFGDFGAALVTQAQAVEAFSAALRLDVKLEESDAL